MSERAKAFAVPAYILLCLLLGGSVQGIAFNLAIQLLGLGLAAWALAGSGGEPLGRPARTILALAGVTFALFLLQLVPLPPGLWSLLPGRDGIVAGYELLGVPLPWLPLSLTPHETMATLLTLIPPFAVLVAMLVWTPRLTWIAATILVATIAGVLLGAFQVGSPNPNSSPWYLYDYSSFGLASGFFANANHMGSLLVISVPLLLGLVRHVRNQASGKKARSGVMMLVVAGMLVLTVGILLNRSLAVVLLLPAVAAVSITLWLRPGSQLRRMLPAAGIAVTLLILAVALSPLAQHLPAGRDSGISSRAEMWSNSAQTALDHAPLGSGLGSFRTVYPLREQGTPVDPSVTNHAHNDYLEIAVEAGVPGIVLLILFLWWWTQRTRAIWRAQGAQPLVLASTIVSGGLLVHSFVDFPLRTAALSTIIAACVAVMARPISIRDGQPEDLWPTRHLRI